MGHRIGKEKTGRERERESIKIQREYNGGEEGERKKGLDVNVESGNDAARVSPQMALTTNTKSFDTPPSPTRSHGRLPSGTQCL